jgi:carbonic anhydrase
LHAPSEHTIGGKYYDLELHLVHTRVYPDDEEDLAVVGIMFDRKEGGNYDNPFIESLNAKRVFENNETLVEEIPLMYLTQQLSFDRFFNYKGSLTTPGCLEIVEWLVLDDP